VIEIGRISVVMYDYDQFFGGKLQLTGYRDPEGLLLSGFFSKLH